MPSLHSAYPVIVLFYATRHRARLFNAVFVAIMLGFLFAAVYTSHQYVLDVLAGMTMAVVGIYTFQLLCRKGPLRRFMQFLIAAKAPKPTGSPAE